MTVEPQIIESDPKLNFYELLGVSKTSTEKEINTAYKKLALKYHPDRTRGDLEAAEKFKEIATANGVLSDPNRRRQYDLSGGNEEATAADYTPIDMEGIGGLRRVAGALIGKLGVPIQTSIAQSSLSEAYLLCQNSGLREDNPKLLPISFGAEYKGSVEKQQSVFFMLRVPPAIAKDGVVLRCTSNNKSRFKLVLFDSAGKVRHQEESSAATSSEGYTRSSLVFAPFEVSTVADTNNIAGLTGEDLPPVFHRLDPFQITKRTLEAGDHLICVYGDNWLRAAVFNLMAIPLSSETQEEEASVLSVGMQLARQREQLKAFQPEFVEAKAKWDATLRKLEELTSHTQELLRARETSYDQLMTSSLSVFAEASRAGASSASSASRGRTGGAFGPAINVNQELSKRRRGSAEGGGAGAADTLFGRFLYR